MFLYYLITGIIAIVVCLILTLLNKYLSNKFSIAYKIIAMVMLIVFFFRYELGVENISNILFLTVKNGFTSKFQVAFSGALLWLLRAGEILLFVQPFFRNKFSNSLVATFGLGVFALNAISIF